MYRYYHFAQTSKSFRVFILVIELLVFSLTVCTSDIRYDAYPSGVSVFLH